MTPTEQDRQAAESAIQVGSERAALVGPATERLDAITNAIAQARHEGVVAGIDKAIITISELKEPTK